MAKYTPEELDKDFRQTKEEIMAGRKRRDAEYHAAYYKANKDKIAERQAAYREKNRDAYNAYHREYRRRLRERRKAEKLANSLMTGGSPLSLRPSR